MREIKLLLFADDLKIYVENLKPSTNELLEFISDQWYANFDHFPIY